MPPSFPSTCSLNILTADPSGVLACVGNLLAAGPLALGLLPVQASAAGAAVAASAPVYLTRAARWLEEAVALEWVSSGYKPGAPHADAATTLHAAPPTLKMSRQALPECFDFALPGTATIALLCLPICAGGRCLGSLTLSFEQGGQPDGPHTHALLQLASALAAPGLLAHAAEPLLQQCGLILGVPAQVLAAAAASEAAAAGEEVVEEEEAAGSGSELFLYDSEADEAAPLLLSDEEEAIAAAAAEAEATGLAPQWAAGACRGPSSEPPDDPGSAAAALVVPGSGEAPPPDSATALAAAAARGRSGLGRAQQPEPESPSALKARAKALARLQLPTPRTSHETRSPGTAGFAAEAAAAGSAALAPPPVKHSPTASEGSSAGSESSSEGRAAALAAQAGASWSSLLRFADPGLERRFALYQAAQLWRVSWVSRLAVERCGIPACPARRDAATAAPAPSSAGRVPSLAIPPLLRASQVDVLSFSLCLAYLAATWLAAPALATPAWLAVQAAAAGGPLALAVAGRRSAYLQSREAALALLFLACGWCPHPPAFTEGLVARAPWLAGSLLPSPRVLLAAVQMCCLVARMQVGGWAGGRHSREGPAMRFA